VLLEQAHAGRLTLGVEVANRSRCGGRLVEPVGGASEGPGEVPADPARLGVPAGGGGSQQILLAIADELVKKVGRGEQGSLLTLSTFLNCSKIIERLSSCQAIQGRVLYER
jgi:hypothetical protein